MKIVTAPFKSLDRRSTWVMASDGSRRRVVTGENGETILTPHVRRRKRKAEAVRRRLAARSR